MKRLFILLLAIVPLLAHSQEKGETIYKKNNSWIIDQTTAEANYYAIVERDSLIVENKRLRQQLKTLEQDNKKLIDKVVIMSDLIANEVQVIEDTTSDLNDVNDDIINLLSKLYKGSNLSATALSTDNLDLYVGLKLNTSLDLNWSFNISALYPLNTEHKNMSYFFSLNYSLF